MDELCPIKNDCAVFVDEDDVVYDASLNLSNIDGNNNKFYFIQLLHYQDRRPAFAVWTHWGRVGENGQNKLEQGLVLVSARALFNRKFKEKTGLPWEKRHDPAKAKKYAMIEKSYGDDTEAIDSDSARPVKKVRLASTAQCTLSEELQDLIRFLFNASNMTNAMKSQNYNFNKLPLGKLSKGTVEKGYLVLKELSDVILGPKAAMDRYKQPLKAICSELTSKYYTVIPHDFGRSRPKPISDETALQAEMDLIETLGNMQIANKVLEETETPTDRQGNAIHPYDARMNSLGLDEAIALDRTSGEFQYLEGYLRHSDDGHDVQSDAEIQHIYRISRSEETSRFVAGGFHAEAMKTKEVRDGRRLLWHGSRSCNFGGILSQGLRIAPPEAPPNCKAFGNGLYLADRASKSAAYCDPWTSNQLGLLLLCEAQLGDPSYIRTDHEYHANASMRKKGLISTKMMTDPSNEPPKWIDAGVVNPDLKTAFIPDHTVKFPASHGFPNEYIVYDIAQVKIRYVFMLRWKGSQQWGIG